MASRGVNRVTLIGTLGKDPDVRYAQSGSALASISVATNESWKDKQTGEKQERTEWHRVKFFGRLAEIAGEYLKKGSQVYIEGSLRTEKYTDKQGVERYSTDIIASEMQMLGGSPRNEGHDSQDGASQAPARRDTGNSNAGGNSNAPSRNGNHDNGNGNNSYGNGGRGGQARAPQAQHPNQQRSVHQPEMAGNDFEDQDIPFIRNRNIF